MVINVVSYNVNGIRSALAKDLVGWIKNENPDIICFQEIKASENQIDTKLFEGLGYKYNYWYPAEKKGYSGTAILSKIKPNNTILGMGNPIYDSEGRTIRLDYDNFTLICSYFPSGTTGDIRQAFKMQFLSDFTNYIEQLKEEKENIIVTGDLNICHKPIDINHPERHLKSSGFLPEEREWFDGFIAQGFVDTFRIFNQEPNQYSWWSFRAGARAKNLGWRIDYFLCTEAISDRIIGANIHSDIYYSDHCPISIKLKI